MLKSEKLRKNDNNSNNRRAILLKRMERLVKQNKTIKEKQINNKLNGKVKIMQPLLLLSAGMDLSDLLINHQIVIVLEEDNSN